MAVETRDTRTMRAFDYPYDPVVLACTRCDRYGRYSKARFIELVGANTQLPEARFKIAAGCPNRPAFPGDIHSRCGVHFPELARGKSTGTASAEGDGALQETGISAARSQGTR